MSAREELRRTGARTMTALLLILCLAPAVRAAGSAEAAVMEWYVTQESVLLYVRHGGQEQSAEARVGTASAGSAAITGADGSVPVVTWLLVDNSLSIGTADRAKIKQVLTDLVAARAPGERFALCTFGTQDHMLLQDSQDYAELKSQIDAIEHSDQSAYLIDALAGVLDAEQSREGQEFVRIVLISDGMDVNPQGYTKDELILRLRERNVPIYTLGCKRDGNEQALKEMYSLSRLTHARSWSLSDLEDTLSVAREMSGAELPVCAEVTIPEALRDGAPRGVQLTFDDGAVVEMTAVMPFGADVPQSPSPVPSVHPDPTPQPTEAPEPAPILRSLPWLLPVVCLAIGAGIGVLFLLRRKEEAERIEPVAGTGSAHEEADLTEQVEEDGGTLVLVSSERRFTLSLVDRAAPGRRFDVPLKGKVSIGRSKTNQIVLDYERSVSGTHCEIYLDGTTFQIRDLDSRNGTYVDGTRVAGVAEISNGSTIKLGRLEFLVEIR